ncbi:MAG: LysM peptidoglycan-binding domain-containing protein [Ilumatobacteraceae bacterium]
MNSTHLITFTSRRTSARRGRRLTLAALAGTMLTFIAPSPGVDAGSAPTRRTCGTASAATYTVAAGDSWFGVATASRVSTAALLTANDVVASAVLHPGDVLCLPTGVTSPPSTSSQGGCASKYIVVSGDSWFAISRAAGVSLNGLLEANDATATTVLRPGALVCLPVGTAQVATAQVATAQAATAQACVAKRAVEAGESWYAISRSTGVPIDALVAANNANRSSAIYPGQSLCLPEVGFGRELPSVLLDATPVRGACRFANSWHASRDGGRSHEGVDLISPSGTPVVAAVNGTLTRQTTGGARSGNAWWLTTSTGTYFFYAHLSSFSSGLSVGSRVQAGDVIGYVGSTGNAVSPHLHFEIHPKGGAAINPYSAIWMVGGCNYDRRYEQTPLS